MAKRYKYDDNGVEVGFITSVSESFCSTCTRSRLSANGQMFTCLFNGNGYDIRDFMRNGASDEEIQNELLRFGHGSMIDILMNGQLKPLQIGKKLKCLILVDKNFVVNEKPAMEHFT